jgi:transcriptional regulator with PAS, ATPase and Fis domain
MVEHAGRRHIGSALDRTGGSVMRSSEWLRISRRTLWEKMNKPRIGHDAAADNARS